MEERVHLLGEVFVIVWLELLEELLEEEHKTLLVVIIQLLEEEWVTP